MREFFVEIQVFRDSNLRININLNLVDGVLVGKLFFLEVDFLSGDDTYLAEVEEDFEIREELSVARCVCGVGVECLNITNSAVSVLVDLVGNLFYSLFIKFFRLAFSDL